MHGRLKRHRCGAAVLIPLAAILAAVGPASAVAGPVSMGVSSDPDVRGADIAAMDRAAVGTLRLTWSQTQLNPRPGTFSWEKMDAVVLAAARQGINVLPVLYRGNQRRPAPPMTQDERASWFRFVREAVDRYGPGGTLWLLNPLARERPVTEWQIWNEPNLKFYWRDDPFPGEYVSLLKLSASAIRGADPAATIVLAGLNASGRGRLRPPRFLAQLYRGGAADYFDAAAVHPYARSPLRMRRRVLALRTVMKRFGDEETPLWVTEVGWSTSGDPVHRLVTSLALQARRAQIAFYFLRRLQATEHIDRVLWFSWKDHDDRGCGWCGGTGLVEADGTAKPALARFTLAAQLFGR